MLIQLVLDSMAAPAMPYRLLKMAEAYGESGKFFIFKSVPVFASLEIS